MFISYDKFFNVFYVYQSRLSQDFVGFYKIVVTGKYPDPLGRPLTIKQAFTLEVKKGKNQGSWVSPLTPEQEREAGFIIVEEWQGRVEKDKNYYKPAKPVIGEPMPYIVSMSPTGLMKIGWTDQMKTIEDLDAIPPAVVAVQMDQSVLDDEKRRRNLEEKFFKTRDGLYLGKLKILNALEVVVKPVDADV